ncbi:UNVERIFIED_CONTAM: hypothetical protein Sindi_0675100 [Sesamum indicum]
MASAAKSLIQTLRLHTKKPWEITGPVAYPEYRSAVQKATEYRVFCPATVPAKAIVPTSLPETVYDIKPYLTAKVIEDDNAIGGGYQK